MVNIHHQWVCTDMVVVKQAPPLEGWQVLGLVYEGKYDNIRIFNVLDSEMEFSGPLIGLVERISVLKPQNYVV